MRSPRNSLPNETRFGSAADRGDNVATIAAIGLLAYASADIAHHVFGHGGACLALGGGIVSLSSIFVNCTARGSAIDLTGPFANLVLGLAALFVARRLSGASTTTRLFWILTAAFNLFWFELQLLYSATRQIDDWAWAIEEFHLSNLSRHGLMAVGAMAYVVTIIVIAGLMSSFAQPRRRVGKIVLAAWLAGGALACATAAFDRAPVSAILDHAAPQSFALSIGLLFVPRRAASVATPIIAAPLSFSPAWMAAAAVVTIASIVLLGPGFAV